MGSPLQNLYASAFPYLFSWVQDTDADADDGSVNARRAGVDQWINLYKSGDYIGRYLWFSGTDEERFADNSANVGTLSGDGKSFDTCIGYGGHTGYWSHPAVLDAVLEAGGVNDFAAPNRTRLYRKGKTKTEVFDVDLADILTKGRLESNFELKPGDVVTVPERLF
jgi:hypothetical protein